MTPDFRHRLEYKEYVETSRFSARITVLSVFTAAVMAGYLLAFYYLQVIQGEYYRELAEANRVRVVSVPPNRGAILDRSGAVMVRNRPAFDVLLNREEARDLEETLLAIAPVLETDTSELQERIARAADRPPYEPVVLDSDVSLGVVSFVESRRADLPGLSISMAMRRFYMEADSGSHALGHVGEITRAMLDSGDFPGALSGDIVGRSGVERSYNEDLRGRRGTKRVVVNSGGRVMGEMAGGVDPEPGEDIRLTINLAMQRELDEAFGDRAGAGVFMDPRNGEILAMSSRPGYDPNLFARRFNREVWKGLVEDSLHPLQNRAVQSAYSPGSTFKPIMAAAALEEGVAGPSTVFFCAGSSVFHGRRFHCHRSGGHGNLDMKRAIQLSCNIYFYNLGSLLGIDAISRYARHIGLGSLTGIDVGPEVPGLVPSPEWKAEVRGERWYPSETISVAIGQGPIMFTPLQMAMAQGFIATNGHRVGPHLRLDASAEWIGRGAEDDMISKHSFSVIRAAEWAAVNEQGTGTQARIEGRDVCGKTGTAQVFAGSAGAKDEDLPPEMRDHAWFVGFAPRDDPRVSFAIIVEHGGHGGEAAAPIARRVLERFFETEEEPAAPRVPPGQVADARTTNPDVF